MMMDKLEDLLEEHSANLEAIELLTNSSIKLLYASLVSELTEAMEESDS